MIENMKARIAGWGRDPVIRGRALGLLIGVVMCFAFYPSQASAQGNQNGMIDAMASLAKMLIDGIIALAAILLAVGIATNFLTGMIEVMVGRPGGLSTTWMRIAGVVLCFVGAIFTIQIANTIIDTLKSYKGTGGINLP